MTVALPTRPAQRRRDTVALVAVLLAASACQGSKDALIVVSLTSMQPLPGVKEVKVDISSVADAATPKTFMPVTYPSPEGGIAFPSAQPVTLGITLDPGVGAVTIRVRVFDAGGELASGVSRMPVIPKAGAQTVTEIALVAKGGVDDGGTSDGRPDGGGGTPETGPTEAIDGGDSPPDASAPDASAPDADAEENNRTADAGGDALLEAAPLDAEAPDTRPTPTELAFACPRDEALRLCYTFDDIGTGTRLVDHSGRGNHGILNTAGVAGGPTSVGYALSFKASTQAAAIPDHESLRLANSELTIEAWIRPIASPLDRGADIILGKVDAADTVGWAFALYGTDIRLYVDGNTSRGAAGVRLGFWNHVAIVVAPAGVRVYIGGKQVGAEQAPMPIPLKTVPVSIGNTNPNVTTNRGGSAYTGDLDVLRIYARSKRPDEICADADGNWFAGTCNPRPMREPNSRPSTRR